MPVLTTWKGGCLGARLTSTVSPNIQRSVSWHRYSKSWQLSPRREGWRERRNSRGEERSGAEGRKKGSKCQSIPFPTARSLNHIRRVGCESFFAPCFSSSSRFADIALEGCHWRVPCLATVIYSLDSTGSRPSQSRGLASSIDGLLFLSRTQPD